MKGIECSGKNKKYDGYSSFDYLEQHEYNKYELAKEQGWGTYRGFDIPLDESEEERMKGIVQKYLMISLHEHAVIMPKDMNNLAPYIKDGRVITAFQALSKSCLDAFFDNGSLFFLLGHSRHGWKWDEVIYDLGMRLCDISHQAFIIICKNVEDIVKAHKEGKIAFIPAFESCSMIENELDRLDVLYGLGVRMLGIAYNEGNALGSGKGESRDRGLTDFGYKVVERLNKLGMAIDISHVGDQTAFDVIEASKKPVFISHAGARAVWDTNRMVPDEVIQACAKKGGVIGIEAAPNTTLSHNNKQGIDAVMEHFMYCEKLVGIDHVAFGPDTLYGDHLGLHKVVSKILSLDKVMKIAEKQEDVVEGLENPTEASVNIIRYLIKNKYSDEAIGKVIGGNVLRVLNEVW